MHVRQVLARKGHVYRRIKESQGLFVDKRGRANVTIERLRQVRARPHGRALPAKLIQAPSRYQLCKPWLVALPLTSVLSQKPIPVLTLHSTPDVAARALTPWPLECCSPPQVWLFNNAPEESLKPVIGLFVARTMNAGEELFREGADADSLYLLVSGQIEMKISVPVPGEPGGAARQTRTVWQAGDEIGVSAVLDTTMRKGLNAADARLTALEGGLTAKS